MTLDFERLTACSCTHAQTQYTALTKYYDPANPRSEIDLWYDWVEIYDVQEREAPGLKVAILDHACGASLLRMVLGVCRHVTDPRPGDLEPEAHAPDRRLTC